MFYFILWGGGEGNISMPLFIGFIEVNIQPRTQGNHYAAICASLPHKFLLIHQSQTLICFSFPVNLFFGQYTSVTKFGKRPSKQRAPRVDTVFVPCISAPRIQFLQIAALYISSIDTVVYVRVRVGYP